MTLLAAVTLSGCVATVAPTPSTTSPAATAPSMLPPSVVLELSAQPAENLDAFNAIAEEVIVRGAAPTTSDFVDALRTAGATDERLEFGTDLTTEGKPVDAYFWALRFDTGCLIGQFRPLETDPEKSRYLSAEAPLVGGKCLVSAER
ncbi:DUF6993 domain-containing protein [Agromyces soli]|uniref:DUF6993 domain-containing protein n=1 Tax=Agromyces soli TaxID=659012 RepID=UPI0031DD63F8